MLRYRANSTGFILKRLAMALVVTIGAGQASAVTPTVERPSERTVLQRGADNKATVPVVIEPQPYNVTASATVMAGYQGTDVVFADLDWNGEHWQGLELEAGGWYRITLEVEPSQGSATISYVIDRIGPGSPTGKAGSAADRSARASTARIA